MGWRFAGGFREHGVEVGDIDAGGEGTYCGSVGIW